MDDTQQQNGMTQPVGDATQPVPTVQPGMDTMQQTAPVDTTGMGMQQPASLGDIAGMTPPPAPMQPEPAPIQMEPAPLQQDAAPMAMPEPAPVAPMDMTMNASIPASPMQDMGASMQQVPASTPSSGEMDDYAYAEDLLDEILDSLDRIEAKLEAIEKKMG